MSESWLRFWDRPHRIYVNDRHLRVHYARIADDILSVLPERGMSAGIRDGRPHRRPLRGYNTDERCDRVSVFPN